MSPEIAGVSAGGMPTRVKCLHVHLGHALAAGPGVNPFGDETLALVGEWWTAGPCVPARLTTQTPKGPRQLDLELHKERRAAEGGNGGQPPDGRVCAIPASAARAAVRAQRALGVRGENPPAGPAAKRWGGELRRS